MVRAIIFVLLFAAAVLPVAAQTGYDLFGKRFDWVLDVYGKHPNDPDSVRLFIREIGKGKETYLVIHGGFGAEHSYLLDPLLPLADSLRLIFYDQRGSLRSRTPDSLVTIDGHIRDIERIRNAYRIDKLNLIAHSMGTYLAMRYLATYPANVGKMILISSLPAELSKDNIGEYEEYQKQHREKMYAAQPELWDKELIERGYKGRFSAAQIGQRGFMYMQQFWSAAGSISRYENWEKDNRGSTFLYNAAAGNAAASGMPEFFDFTEALQNHSSDIIFIKGTDDYLSPSVLRNSIDGIRNCKLYLIENAGHNIWIEQPERFIDLMRSIVR